MRPMYHSVARSKLYRMLLRALPFDFRSEFGSEMEEVFLDQHQEAQHRGGVQALARLWWQTILGVFHTAPREHLAILRQDVEFALRMMKRNVGYTALAVVTLALGIGANTAIFSVINAILVRPLPYPDGQQLVLIQQQAPKAGVADMRFSVAEISDYSHQNHTMSGTAEYHAMTFTLLGRGEAQRVRTGVVSAHYFDLFGIKPALGRTFVASDDEPGAPPVLVLSHEYWQNNQGGDPGIVGRTFQMNDRVHTVVGVLPPVPQYPNENDVYMPTSACPFRGAPQAIGDRDSRMMRLFGRTKPGVSLDQVNSDISVIASGLERQFPKSYTNAMGYRTTAASLDKELTRQAKPTLLVLLGAAAFVLLIACANVANFTLARMAKRERELLIRAALGAGPGRLLRQLVTENLLIGLLASLLGLGMAAEGMKLLIEFAGLLTPRAREINIDFNVLMFSLLAAVFTSVVVGSISALYPRENVAAGLKEGGGQSTIGRKSARTRNALIVCQVAFSFVLMIGAGLMLRSVANLQQVDPGFVPQRVLTMGINLNWSKYKTGAQTLSFSRLLLQRLRNQPGVGSAAIASGFPLDPESGPFNRRFQVEGQVLREGESAPLSAIRNASVDYFRTLGIPLVAGRAFLETDDERASQVAIVNSTLARHYWRNEDPVGRRISLDRGETWTKIVGVVGDVREFRLDREPGDELYLPIGQAFGVACLLVRTGQEPMGMASRLRRIVLDIDPETAVSRLRTLEEARSQSLASPRITAQLLGLFAGLALLIAATGVGGTLALSVSERTHEIGIRIALGARSAQLLRDLVGRGVGLVVLGLVAGWVSALALTHLLTTLLFQVTPTDPLTFAGVSAVLVAAALIACYAPARRATRIDPLSAIRHE